VSGKIQRCWTASFFVLPRPGAGQGGGGGPAADFARSILGQDDDESKAASGGRRRNRKMRWGDGVGVQWSRFQAAHGDHVIASAKWAGVRKSLPGACDSASHPTVTRIKVAIVCRLLCGVRR
jgi:hypothetical protein